MLSTRIPDTRFINLEFQGINPATVAYYTANFAANELTCFLINGDEITLHGDVAQRFFEHFQQLGSSLPLPLSDEKQNALESLRAFFAGAFNRTHVCGTDMKQAWIVTDSAKAIAEQALSVLGA